MNPADETLYLLRKENIQQKIQIERLKYELSLMEKKVDHYQEKADKWFDMYLEEAHKRLFQERLNRITVETPIKIDPKK